MKYRIEKQIYDRGGEYFYPQYKKFLFWQYYWQTIDISGSRGKIWFRSLIEAKASLAFQVQDDQTEELLKKVYIDYP